MFRASRVGAVAIGPYHVHIPFLRWWSAIPAKIDTDANCAEHECTKPEVSHSVFPKCPNIETCNLSNTLFYLDSQFPHGLSM